MVPAMMLEAASGSDALVISEKHGATIAHERPRGRRAPTPCARPERAFTSGSTPNAIVHHSPLDSGIAFIQKPITLDALAQ
jgi:hypothetical protein